MSSITQAPSHKRSLLGLGLVAGLTAMGTAGIMYGLPQTLPPPPADPLLPLLARSLDQATTGIGTSAERAREETGKVAAAAEELTSTVAAEGGMEAAGAPVTALGDQADAMARQSAGLEQEVVSLAARLRAA
jgi:hypothetical protein